VKADQEDLKSAQIPHLNIDNIEYVDEKIYTDLEFEDLKNDQIQKSVISSS